MKKSFIIFSFLFIFFSCSDDTFISGQESYNSVEHARKWFEQNINESSATPSNGRVNSRPKNVSWENGVSYVKGKTQTVEVPVQYETELIAYPQNINKNASYKNSTKLLMFDDGKGGYNVFVMRIMPDMASVPELEKNTYDKKANSFTGDIIYHTWEGKPLVYTRYENSKRIEWNYIEQTSKKEGTDGARVTSECYSIEVEWYSIACSAYGCGEPIYLYSDYYYFCSGGSSPYTDEYADPGDLYGGGGGGGSSGDVENPLTLILPSPDRPIADMSDYLDCFNVSQNATITIYVDQPIPNSSDAWKATLSGAVVGHTFVSITQGNNTSVFGFYPNGDPNPYSPTKPGVMGNDSGEAYDVSISTTVSGSVLETILNYSINYNSTYNLNTYNCSDFGIEIGNLAGLNLPDAFGTWPGGGGSNPGALGQHIRGVTPSGSVTTNTTGGTSPANNKGC